MDIVTRRVAQLGRSIGLPGCLRGAEEIRRVVTVFRELRSGRDRRPADPAEVTDGHPVPGRGNLGGDQRHRAGRALRRRRAAGRGHRRGDHRRGLKDPVSDAGWPEYLEPSSGSGPGWGDFYRACREVAG